MDHGCVILIRIIVPKVRKTDEGHKAVAVEVTIQAKALTRCYGLAGSDQQEGGLPP